MSEKVLRNKRADGVTTGVLGAGRAAAIAIEAGQWVGPTGFELRPENIQFHSPSMASAVTVESMLGSI